MAALVDFPEVGQVAICAPCPCFRGSIDVVGKYRDRHGERDLGGFLRGRQKNALAASFPVQPRRGGGGVRQPVQRDVVQELVLREQALGLAIVVVIHEGRKACWRVRQGLADHLRPCPHHCAVGSAHLVEGIERVECPPFLFG